ncbi:MAG: hypothetical protein V1729_04765 [Candidatus Woesearchaeota archaeon]
MSDREDDSEIALFLLSHIHNPCVAPGTGSNIREFYIREAERLIETFKDPGAKMILEDSIDLYTNK